MWVHLHMCRGFLISPSMKTNSKVVRLKFAQKTCTAEKVVYYKWEFARYKFVNQIIINNKIIFFSILSSGPLIRKILLIYLQQIWRSKFLELLINERCLKFWNLTLRPIYYQHTVVVKKKFFRLKYKSSNMKFNTFHLAYKSILLLGTRDTKSENSISNIRFVFDTFCFC